MDTSRPEPKLSALYQELILDHYRRPRNKGMLEHPTHAVSLNNPLCGDEIDLHLLVQDAVIRDVRFVGRGCSISQASASMMTQLLKEKSVPQGSKYLSFSQTKTGSWAKGDYRAEVWIGDEKVNTQHFNVTDKSKAGK